MKRWKIVLISVIASLALILGGGLCIFHFFVIPRYVDPFLKSAVELLDSEDVKREISDLAKEFADKGLLDEELLEQYLEIYSEAEINDDADHSKIHTSSNNTENSVGAKNIQVKENVSGNRYSYGKNTSSESLVEVKEKSDKSNSAASDKEKSLYQRIMENVSPEDLTRGYELAAKFDLEKVRSLMHNREALKEYIRSVLTDSEYSEVVAFYLKYSYLLEEQ